MPKPNRYQRLIAVHQRTLRLCEIATINGDQQLLQTWLEDSILDNLESSLQVLGERPLTAEGVALLSLTRQVTQQYLRWYKPGRHVQTPKCNEALDRLE